MSQLVSAFHALIAFVIITGVLFSMYSSSFLLDGASILSILLIFVFGSAKHSNLKNDVKFQVI